MLRRRSNEDVKLVIDDNDTSVTYSGDWKNDSSAATYFKTYGSTIHYTWQLNASASISFYGSYITVFGIIPSNSDLKGAGITKAGPQIQTSYQLDNGSPELFNATIDTDHLTNQVLFQPNTTEPDGYHTLIITNLVGILTLDYFTIVPDSGSSPYIQKIDDASPIITYNNAKPLFNTSGVDYNSTLHDLSSPQSTAFLNFNGNFVAVYGALPVGNSLPIITFTLDSGVPPVTGQGDSSSGSMPRLPASRKQRLSQVLFWKSSTLANSQHNLLITVTQGDFFLDFILIQTLDGAGSGTTVPSQSLKPTAPYVSLPSSTKAPYGNTTSSGSTPRSPPTGASSDHTKNTSVIVGGAVGGVVGFVVLLLAALYMIRILSKRRSGLWSKTQSNTESSSQALVQAGLPVTAIATPGTPYLIDGSGYGQVLMSFILGPSFKGSVPPPYRPRDETQETQVSAEMNEGGKDDVQYGHDDKFAAFGQVQTDQLV